ncbi:MAG: 50S ribosomal protein L3 N(5)-glutamine methyltransferase [Cephaloticoccus sp.]|nr:50S ribosomal protein L3 N(5)-glutamine methyltransferase [Cephaloticoccus sp.]MCF7761214.1 50S ribosomal protein L3 N(5)-glutamine methyltransferase [Cephaloticoccus sp.]
MEAKPANPWVEAVRLTTPGAWLEFAEALYRQHDLALGQIATTAHDEALYLILHTLQLPMDSDEGVLAKTLTGAQREALTTVFRRRVVDHTPAAYLTREAWLNEERFYVDERVLIPRSYFLEIIPGQLDELLPDPAKVTRVVDVCTGSGCLAILLAKHFPQARVDAVDLSTDALAVAQINVESHKLTRRVTLHASDVFDAVPPAQYDVILSNPPYEPSAHCDALPTEFKREPRLALDGGGDGLDIIRKLLRQSRTRLKPHGIVLLEVGGLGAAMDREFAALEPQWLETEDESNCVCLIRGAALKTWRG